MSQYTEKPFSSECRFQLRSQIGRPVLQKLYTAAVRQPVLQIDVLTGQGNQLSTLGIPSIPRPLISSISCFLNASNRPPSLSSPNLFQ